jgi:hypothetical protein
LPIVTSMFVPGEWGLTAIALVPIVGGGAWWWLAATDRRGLALSAFATTSVVLLVAVFALGAARVSRYRNATWLAETIAAREMPASGELHRHVAAYRYFRHSFAYYLGGPIARCGEPDDVSDFLNSVDGGYIVALDHDAERLMAELPGRLAEVSRQRRFLESGEVVVLRETGERGARFTVERSPRRMSR